MFQSKKALYSAAAFLCALFLSSHIILTEAALSEEVFRQAQEGNLAAVKAAIEKEAGGKDAAKIKALINEPLDPEQPEYLLTDAIVTQFSRGEEHKKYFEDPKNAKNHLDLVNYLLDNGANVDQRDVRLNYALDMAASYGHKDILDTILKKRPQISEEAVKEAVRKCIVWNQLDSIKKLMERKPKLDSAVFYALAHYREKVTDKEIRALILGRFSAEEKEAIKKSMQTSLPEVKAHLAELKKAAAAAPAPAAGAAEPAAKKEKKEKGKDGKDGATAAAEAEAAAAAAEKAAAEAAAMQIQIETLESQVKDLEGAIKILNEH